MFKVVARFPPGQPDAFNLSAPGDPSGGCGALVSPIPVTPLLSVPLHPPTERAALTDQGAAIGWVRSWSAFTAAPYAVA